MNLGAMTPSDISISPLASLGQAVCSSCLLVTVCLPGREHASQGDTSVHSATTPNISPIASETKKDAVEKGNTE